MFLRIRHSSLFGSGTRPAPLSSFFQRESLTDLFFRSSIFFSLGRGKGIGSGEKKTFSPDHRKLEKEKEGGGKTCKKTF